MPAHASRQLPLVTNLSQAEKMRRLAVTVSVALAFCGCTGPTFSKASAARVVVPADQLPGGFGFQGWTPGNEHIASCEAAIAHALAKSKLDLGEYHLRLGGVVRAGTRHILGIAAHKSTGSRYLQPASEESIVLLTFGGGKSFFTFVYDVDARKLESLEFNAPL